MATTRAAIGVLKHFIWRRNVSTSSGSDIETLVEQLLQVTSVRRNASKLHKFQALSQLAYCLRDSSDYYERAVPALPALLKLYNRESADISTLARWALILLGHPLPLPSTGIRILSIDGGGVRGIVPVLMLQEIERMSGRRIYELFDYVCGTSTGSLVLALSCIRRDPLDSVEQAYRSLCSEVFGTNTLVGITKLFLRQAFYDTQKFESILQGEEGFDQYLIDTALDPLIPKVSFISTVASQPVLKPFVFRNYRHFPTKSSYRGSGDVEIWEAIRASTAAPGYFEEMPLASYVHQDGGLLNNNPTAIALHEAQRIWQNIPIQCVLSLGTGYARSLTDDNNSNKWRDKLLNVIASATDTEVVHTILQDLLSPSKYFRFNPILSEQITMDENRDEKLQLMTAETNTFIRSQEEKFTCAVTKLVECKSKLKWVSQYWGRFTGLG